MARPRRNDNKIHLHARRNGNSRYASSNEAYEKDGTRKYRVIDWGTLDETTGSFRPSASSTSTASGSGSSSPTGGTSPSSRS